MKVVIIVVILAAFFTSALADTWAVIVAGSNSFYNYRHQSDVCHSYHVLSSNGIPDSNIITMMYDDIASDPSNPFPGQIFNVPNGPDVYKGVPKDYTGDNVTPDNFLAILNGKTMTVGSGKTLKSTANDDVFIFFSDHGAPGLIAFPAEAGYLYASDLIKTLNAMAAAKKFKQLTLYIEACESGSMFASGLLADNINIYAVTAANPTESSWACDYDDTIGTYLNDCFSVNWMLDSEAHHSAINSYTLEDDFTVVHAATNQSHVCAYGQTSINQEPMGNFIASHAAAKSIHRKPAAAAAAAASVTHAHSTYADSREVLTEYLRARVNRALSTEERTMAELELTHHMHKRSQSDYAFKHLRSVLSSDVDFEAHFSEGNDPDQCNTSSAAQTVENFDCYKAAIQQIESASACGRFDDYSLKHMRDLANACNQMGDANRIAALVVEGCANF